ncbi:hypothetical protein COCNU_14G012900 [Cocos nucifera]|uniref:Uncharacterized protein n=1 Tax=Cocos nucifera TaxID=13894 RepID=A0A8K0IW73_COCNU|nr:hypothetical protein COCNU_14G012900 [Cocos nucifera]
MMAASSSFLLLFLHLPRINHHHRPPLLSLPALNAVHSSRFPSFQCNKRRRKTAIPFPIVVVPGLSRSRSRSLAEGKGGDGEAIVQEEFVEPKQTGFHSDGVENGASDAATHSSRVRSLQQRTAVSKEANSLGIREPVYEVVEAALLSRIQRLEQKLMDVEPRVVALLEVLPNRLTADVLEELRLAKQTLVELGSRAGALKQMLLDLLEDPHEIRCICVMGRNCTVRRGNNDLECSLPLEKKVAEEEEEEIEMLLENYLQRCESCHGHAEKLLDSAKEMEDSIAVNLRCESCHGHAEKLLDSAKEMEDSIAVNLRFLLLFSLSCSFMKLNIYVLLLLLLLLA